jgi:hypothetical protein
VFRSAISGPRTAPLQPTARVVLQLLSRMAGFRSRANLKGSECLEAEPKTRPERPVLRVQRRVLEAPSAAQRTAPVRLDRRPRAAMPASVQEPSPAPRRAAHGWRLGLQQARAAFRPRQAGQQVSPAFAARWHRPRPATSLRVQVLCGPCGHEKTSSVHKNPGYPSRRWPRQPTLQMRKRSCLVPSWRKKTQAATESAAAGTVGRP